MPRSEPKATQNT